MTKAKDWTGVKSYFLTFIRPTNQRGCSSGGSGGIKWEALCECGNTTIVIPRNVAGIGKNGRTKSCGCYHDSHARKYEPVISSARQVWSGNYKDLSFDDFYRLSQQPCFYCGAGLSNRLNSANVRSRRASQYQRSEGDFVYNGIDRIDSSKGHALDNVVSCCRICNMMKSNASVEEFATQVERIYEHMRSTWRRE